mmetsp:Transcript_7761/g.17520  ORF Transcript_7761/g.17520 Transcript_7761/m.17520 type:complete len:85 (-) Transcript_7761:181-435(-)
MRRLVCGHQGMRWDLENIIRFLQLPRRRLELMSIVSMIVMRSMGGRNAMRVVLLRLWIWLLNDSSNVESIDGPMRWGGVNAKRG